MRYSYPVKVRGLTLLEVVISVALITMLVSALLTFFWQSLELREQAALIVDRTQIARQVLDRLATELRGCVGVEQFGFPIEQRMAGDRRSILFLTTTLPDEKMYQFFGEFDELPPGQHDLREISYELWIDPEETTEDNEPIVGGILRTEKRTLNQMIVDEEDPLQLRHDLWSHELGYIEFRYFDGVEWTTTWEVTQGNSLPQLIMVTVGFDSITQADLDDEDLTMYPVEEYPLGDDLPHPDRYSIIVRLPAADRFFSSRIERVGQEFTEQMGVEGGF
ncbi:MAG: prepilin-type N-terminal cleavage/methylation domain-containing protein [Planctomycetota bacterium]